MSKAYKNSYLIVEGSVEEGMSAIRNPLVFWGALAKVASEWDISVIFTPNEKHTAMFLHSLAKKLQRGKKKRVTVRKKTKVYTLR